MNFKREIAAVVTGRLSFRQRVGYFAEKRFAAGIR